MGMIAKVRVSFTMVAWSRVFAPGCMPSQAEAVDARNAFSINELAIILDMDVEEIRDTLRLTGDDK